MLNLPRKQQESTKHDEVKEALLNRLLTLDPTDPQYRTLIILLERLNNAAPPARTAKFSPDVMLTVFGNLAGIVVIVAYEQKHVFASQAKNFILKLK